MIISDKQVMQLILIARAYVHELVRDKSTDIELPNEIIKFINEIATQQSDVLKATE